MSDLDETEADVGYRGKSKKKKKVAKAKWKRNKRKMSQKSIIVKMENSFLAKD